MDSPSAKAIKDVRTALGLTMEDAAAIAMVTARAWVKWERGERAISPPAWALFRLRTGLASLKKLDAETQRIRRDRNRSKT